MLLIMKKGKIKKMVKYGIKSSKDDHIIYYAGKHYQRTAHFTGNIYQATLYSDGTDADAMVEALQGKYVEYVFYVIVVKVTIQEITPK